MKYQGHKVDLFDWIFLHYMDAPKFFHLLPWVALGWYLDGPRGAGVAVLFSFLVILLVVKMNIDIDKRLAADKENAAETL